MGPLILSGMNATELRVFQYEQPFYNIFKQRRLQFSFGQRPDELANVPTIDQRIWEKHQTYLKRLDNHPLKKAEYYSTLKRSKGVNTVRELAEITGEDWSYIAKVLRTLELPAPIREFLMAHPGPAVVKTFHLRCLLEIVSIGNEAIQFSRFRELLANP